MLNAVWVSMVLIAIICGAVTGRMEAVTQQSVIAVKGAVMLAIGLVGIMAFWLGMVEIGRQAGLMRLLAKGMRPLMVRLFPEVPAEHPAMSAMIMNMSANMLGLGNAATPFGLKAMMELDKLNQHKGTATNAMALFLAINTSNVAIFPTSVVAVRAAMGAANPTGVVFTTFVATLIATIIAVFVAKSAQGWKLYQAAPSLGSESTSDADEDEDEESASKALDVEALAAAEARAKALQEAEEALGPTSFPPTPLWARLLQWGFWLALLFAAVLHMRRAWHVYTLQQMGMGSFGVQGIIDVAMAPSTSFFSLGRELFSFWLMPTLIAAIALLGVSRGVKVYEALVTGAKEGWDVAIRIIPYLVAILVAIGMFRASGAMDIMVSGLSPLTEWFGMPGETLPMALMRPLSGSGALGIMVETMQVHGVDSMIGNMVSTFYGSTETTFYTLAVYYGAVGIYNVRHTLIACLIADVVAVLASVWLCLLLFG